jgi:cytochrome c5
MASFPKDSLRVSRGRTGYRTSSQLKLFTLSACAGDDAGTSRRQPRSSGSDATKATSRVVWSLLPSLCMSRPVTGNCALLALALFLLFANGCGKGSESNPESVETIPSSEQSQASSPGPESTRGVEKPDATAEAKEIFDTRCSSCHGDEGRGNGPASAVLNPKPQNFHDQKWQASVSDEQLTQAIIYGGSAVGKSPAMAPNPDLQEKPDVVKALIAHVRELGKQK